MSSWDSVWEKIFRERKGWGRYPPEELVRFIARSYYAVADRSSIRVLEIGCGPGGGPAWFLAREGFCYFGIDGSPTAIAKAKQYFQSERLTGEFVEGDLLCLPWPGEYFDCVIDVACLQCNSEKDTQGIIENVWRVLKPGGRHFSLTLGSGSWGSETGQRLDDVTIANVNEGPFKDMGRTRFADRDDLARLYANFRNLELNYSVRSLENGTRKIRNWVLTCER